MTLIQSPSNKQFKTLKSLNVRKNRYKQNLYKIEGFRIVQQAVLENQKLECVFIKAAFQEDERLSALAHLLESTETEVYLLDDDLFDQVSDTVNSQGILATLPIVKCSLIEGLDKGVKRLLLLDRIQDPGNLGTMIRSADAAGFEGVVLGKGTVDPYNEKVLRSTMGSIFQIPVYLDVDLVEVIPDLKKHEFKVYATALDGAVAYDRIDYPEKVALIIGNEGSGVDGAILDAVHQNVLIPMAGKAESLNASIAASIAMYEVYRQMRQKDGVLADSQ